MHGALADSPQFCVVAFVVCRHRPGRKENRNAAGVGHAEVPKENLRPEVHTFIVHPGVALMKSVQVGTAENELLVVSRCRHCTHVGRRVRHFGRGEQEAE